MEDYLKGRRREHLRRLREVSVAVQERDGYVQELEHTIGVLNNQRSTPQELPIVEGMFKRAKQELTDLTAEMHVLEGGLRALKEMRAKIEAMYEDHRRLAEEMDRLETALKNQTKEGLCLNQQSAPAQSKN